MAPPAPLLEPTAPSLEEETISRLLEVTPFHWNPRPLAPRLLLAGGYGAQDTPLLFYTWCGKKKRGTTCPTLQLKPKTSAFPESNLDSCLSLFFGLLNCSSLFHIAFFTLCVLIVLCCFLTVNWGSEQRHRRSELQLFFPALLPPDPPLCCGLCMPALVTWLRFYGNSGLSNHLRYDLYSLEERGGGG